MKIDNRGQNVSTDRSERAAQADRLDAGNGARGFAARQVGLDRVDISHAAHTAARLVETTMHSRLERVSRLASQFQSGGYQPNMAKVSEAILNDDTNAEASYAG
ncbi:MAG: flagellar biosynthesis anti-sigma factor FlgM [Acidobacteriota bacterium]